MAAPQNVLKLVRQLNSTGLTTDGLFRSSSSIKGLQEAKLALDNGVELDFATLDPLVLAQLLKLQLRDLAEPILTFAKYNAFVETGSVSPEARTVKLRELVSTLPSVNRRMCEIIFLFFSRVAEHSSQNKMNSDSLSQIFGPLVLRPEKETLETIQHGTAAATVALALIKHYDQIFIAPAAPVSSPSAGSAASSSSASDVHAAQFQPVAAAPMSPPHVAAVRSAASGSHMSPSSKGMTEEQRVAKMRQVVDVAILQLVGRLEEMKVDALALQTVPDAVELAKKVRAVRRLLDGAGELPQPERGLTCVSGDAELQGRRPTMEDAHVLIDDVLSSSLGQEFASVLQKMSRIAMYAVFDGHSGRECAAHAESILPRMLLQHSDFVAGDIESALTRTFFDVDKLIMEKCASQNIKSGSTAVVSVIVGKTIYVANVGDSECVVYTRKKGEEDAYDHNPLSAKHSPTNPRERERIVAAGGHVFHNRLYGTIAVSRSFGDMDYKRPIADGDFIIPDPHTSRLDLTPADTFMILACDGLFEKLDYDTVAVHIAKERKLGKNEKEIAVSLAKAAYDRGSKDNITALVVFFNWA